MLQFHEMKYPLSLLFAVLLVAAQSSWKVAVDSSKSPFHTDLTLHSVARFVFSPLVLLGMFIYALALLLYMYLLSKYQFSFIQSMAIPLSLIFSILVAVAFFNEHLILVNYAGLVLIVFGIVLITLR